MSRTLNRAPQLAPWMESRSWTRQCFVAHHKDKGLIYDSVT